MIVSVIVVTKNTFLVSAIFLVFMRLFFLSTNSRFNQTYIPPQLSDSSDVLRNPCLVGALYCKRTDRIQLFVRMLGTWFLEVCRHPLFLTIMHFLYFLFFSKLQTIHVPVTIKFCFRLENFIWTLCWHLFLIHKYTGNVLDLPANNWKHLLVNDYHAVHPPFTLSIHRTVTIVLDATQLFFPSFVNLIGVHPKICKSLFILRLPNFESKLQNPAYFYEVLWRNLEDITEADKI